MHIRNILERRETSFSFEFFPPASQQGADDLMGTINELDKLRPSFVSITYGAGGTTRDTTHALVKRICTQTPLEAVPHLTCVQHSRDEITDILTQYAQLRVGNILALRGDAPKDDPSYNPDEDSFKHAADLVRLIRAFNDTAVHPDSRGFGIGVAGFPEGHPATPNRLQEMDYLKAKVDQGADWICTQLFFTNDVFYDFCERCELAGIRVPIIAGIMPITSTKNLTRMADLAAGVRIPAKLLKALQRCDDNQDSVKKVGVHWATQQCLDLLDKGTSGVHFYTLNKSTATQDIYASLGVADSTSLGG
ncbi:MAG: methylenetetrahydrofolate reductase [NAD(P)H] [Planctomycetota bacterium]|jgi:methylenetetrahydrofolate reductase (NADPH)